MLRKGWKKFNCVSSGCPKHYSFKKYNPLETYVYSYKEYDDEVAWVGRCDNLLDKVCETMRDAMNFVERHYA